MFSYLILYCVLFLIFFFFARKNEIRNQDLLVLFLPLFAFIILKGSIGSDFKNYVILIGEILKSEYVYYKPEPFFVALVRFIALFFTNPIYIINTIGLVIITLFLSGLWISDKAERPFLLSILLPYFLFDMTTNVLRFGLAAGLFYLSMALFSKNRIKLWLLFLVLALASHATIVLLLLMFMVFYFRKSYLKTNLIIMAAAILYYVGNFLNRFGVYKGQTVLVASIKPSLGISVLVLQVLMAAYFYKTKLNKLAFLLLGATAVLIVASSTSIGFVRGNHLLLFGTLILFSKMYPQFENESYWRKYFLIFVFFICCLFKLNNIYNQSGGAESPYFPFNYAWEVESAS